MQNYYNPYQFQMPNPAMQSSAMSGRIVNDFNEIGINEIPMTGVALFPKSDRSVIQMKEWCADGTIRTTAYFPQNQAQMEKLSGTPEKAQNGDVWAEIEGIKEEIRSLSERIDKPARARVKKDADEL